jgi:hypothetical protein
MLCVFIRHPARAVEVLYISVCSSTISCDMNLLPSDYWSAPKVVNCNQLVLFTKSICSLHENIAPCCLRCSTTIFHVSVLHYFLESLLTKSTCNTTMVFLMLSSCTVHLLVVKSVFPTDC